MVKRAKEYLDNPDYLTLKQAAEEAGLDPVTFKKYASNIGISGNPVSKYTFFTKDDVEKVREMVEKQANIWLRMLEKATQKKWVPVQNKK